MNDLATIDVTNADQLAALYSTMDEGPTLARARINKDSSALLEDGRIFYPAGRKWAKNLIDICSAFPTGDNDDIVDTCTQAWLRLRKGWFITHSTDYDEDEIVERNRLTLYG